MHLRMTGSAAARPAGRAAAHARARSRFDAGAQRCASSIRAASAPASSSPATTRSRAFFAARLGVEPFDAAFTAAALRALARGRRAPIKPFLLDQRHVAGVGNIYADEALFRAGVHPLRAGRQPAAARSTRGCATRCARRSPPGSTRAARRSTTSATSTASAAPSRTASSCTAARASRARVCGTPIRKLVVGGRGTYVCARCQPRAAAARGARQRRPARASGGEQLGEPPGAIGRRELDRSRRRARRR